MKRLCMLLLLSLPLCAQEQLNKTHIDQWLTAVQLLSQWAAKSPGRADALDSMLVEPEQVLAELKRQRLSGEVGALVNQAGFADLSAWADVNHRIQVALLALETRDNELINQLEAELDYLKLQGADIQRIQALERAVQTFENIQQDSRQDQQAIWPYLARIRTSLGMEP